MRFRRIWLPSLVALLLLSGGSAAPAQDSPKELKELDKLEGYDSLPGEKSVKGDMDKVPNEPVETIIIWSEASPTSGKAPLAVSFTADPPHGVDNPTYTWTFSDGGSATGQTVSHTFATPGIHKAMLTVTSAKGDLGLNELRIKVTE
jgi:hypothetical protein